MNAFSRSGKIFANFVNSMDNKMLTVEQLKRHLCVRGLDLRLYTGVSFSEGEAIFPLYNFGGKRTGSLYYHPHGEKNGKNPKDGRYFTYVSAGETAVFGLESLELRGPIFLTGGMFKAATLHRLGYPALHVSSVSPKVLRQQLGLLRRPFFAIGDNDAEGAQFVRRWGGVQSPVDVDEMADEEVVRMVQSMVGGF